MLNVIMKGLKKNNKKCICYSDYLSLINENFFEKK